MVFLSWRPDFEDGCERRAFLTRLFFTRRLGGVGNSWDELYSLPDDEELPLESLEELELDPQELVELLVPEELLLSPFEFGEL